MLLEYTSFIELPQRLLALDEKNFGGIVHVIFEQSLYRDGRKTCKSKDTCNSHQSLLQHLSIYAAGAVEL